MRFKDAGFAPADDQVVGPTPKNRNLVVRYRGTGAHKPVLLLAHLDVVEAKRDDWTYDPFVLTENDGYFYGRGTQDVKGGAAMLVTALLRMKQEKFVPDRDLILALTAGEEGGMPYNGVQWLIANKKPLIDAEYVDQRRRRRRRDGERQAHVVRRSGRGEGLSLGVADGEESRRPQLAAAQGQRDL